MIFQLFENYDKISDQEVRFASFMPGPSRLFLVFEQPKGLENFTFIGHFAVNPVFRCEEKPTG